MDKGAEVHANESEVGTRLGFIPVRYTMKLPPNAVDHFIEVNYLVCIVYIYILLLINLLTFNWHFLCVSFLFAIISIEIAAG